VANSLLNTVYISRNFNQSMNGADALLRAMIESDGTGVFIHNHMWGVSFHSIYHTYGCTEMCSVCFPQNSSAFENSDVGQMEMRQYYLYCDEYDICYCDGYTLTCARHLFEMSDIYDDDRSEYTADTYDSVPELIFGDDIEYELTAGRNHPYEYTLLTYAEVITAECSICYGSGISLLRISCGHVFHMDCLNRWFLEHDSCPLCRGVAQMLRGVRNMASAVVSLPTIVQQATDMMEDTQERIDETLDSIREFSISVNRGVETFELLMHVLSFATAGDTLPSGLVKLWNVLHIIMSAGKIICKQFLPTMLSFDDLDTDGERQVDFGTLFATSAAAVNFLPPSMRGALDFMTRHSRTRFLTDFSVLQDCFYFVMSAPRIIVDTLISHIPADFLFHRTATTLLGKLSVGLDIVYAHLPGSVEHRMTQRATDVIRQFVSEAKCVRSQSYLSEFKTVFQFFEELYFSIVIRQDLPQNLKYIVNSLRAIKRVVDSQESNTRLEPLWFYFYGPTGRGKTVFTANVVQSLVSLTSFVHQCKPNQKEFFDGYCNEEIFCEDDITKCDQLHKYLSFVSSIAQPLEVCDSDMKGVKKFTSQAILTTSNYLPEDLFTKQETAETARALTRRFYMTDFSDVEYDGTQYNVHKNAKDVNPTVRIFKTDNDGMCQCVHTFNPNNIQEFTDFLFDTHDVLLQTRKARPPVVPITRVFGRAQALFDIFPNVYRVMHQIVDPIIWSMNNVLQYLKDFVYGEIFVPTAVLSTAAANTCVVCLGDTHPVPFTTLGCGHSFCTTCVSRWLRQSSTCPMCRTPVVYILNKGLIDKIKDARLSVQQFCNYVMRKYQRLSHDYWFVTKILEGTALGIIVTLIMLPINYLAQKVITKIWEPKSIVKVQRETRVVNRVHVQMPGSAQSIYPDRISESFPTEIERVRNNMFFSRMVFKNNESVNGIITFVDGLSFICPAHFLICNGTVQNEVVVYAEDQEGAQLISGQEFVIKYVNVSADIAILTYVVSNQPRLFTNVSSCFSGELLSHDLFLVTPDQCLSIPYPTRLQYDMSYFVFAQTPVHAPIGSFSYPYQADGLCGALLVNREGKILGMHVALEKNSKNGIARTFSRSVRSEVYKCSEIGSMRKLSPISAFVVDTDQYRHVPSETSIVNSDLSGVFEIERVPAVLKGKDLNGENILHRAVKKNIKPVFVCDETAMKYVEYATERFLFNYSSRELSQIEIIHGNGVVPRIDPTSSGGIPYNKKNSELIDYENSTFDNDVFKNIKKMEDEFANNEFGIETIVFGDTLKDELRDIEKEFKPRLFAAGPLHFTVLLKKYFADLIYNVEQRMLNGIMIGINALGKEWDLFARKMQSKGPNIIPGDFENWDGGMLARFQEILNKLLSNRTTNPKFTLWLLTHLIRTTRRILNEMIVTTHSVPSGHALTAFYNSMINLMYQFYAYYILCPYKMWSFAKIYDQQMRDLFSGKYGDDVLINVSNNASKFFNAFSFGDVMQTIGVGFTDENKKMHVTPFVTLDKCTFLKRGFCYHSKLHRIVGPLALKTLCSSISYVTDRYRMEELVDEKVKGFQREIYLHEYLYASLMKILCNKYYEVYGFQPDILTIDALQKLYERDEFEVVYGLTGKPQMLKWEGKIEPEIDKRAGVDIQIFDENDKIFHLLVKGRDIMQPDGYVAYGTWGIPKGHLKEKEEYWEAALRELFEETSIQATKWDLQNEVCFDSNRVFTIILPMNEFLKMSIQSIDDEILSFCLVCDFEEVHTNSFTRRYSKAR